MFNFENEMNKKKAEYEVRSELAKVISKLLLESDTFPEEKKMCVRIMDGIGEVRDAMLEVAPGEVLANGNINIENAKKLCFLLHATAEQLKAFAINNPISSEENHDEI